MGWCNYYVSAHLVACINWIDTNKSKTAHFTLTKKCVCLKMVMSIPGCMATRHSGLVYIDTVKNYNTITDVTDLRDLVHTWHAEMYFRSWSETLAVLARERYCSFGHIGFKVSIHLNCTSHWVSVMYSSVSLWKSLQSEGNWKRAIQSFVYCMERIYIINLSEQSLRTEVDLNC